MEEEAYCPQCDAALGSEEEVGIYCWKCGLAFGDEPGTEPIIREKTNWWRNSGWRVAVGWFATPLIGWTVVEAYDHVSWLPSGVLGWIPVTCLIVFTIFCLLKTAEWIIWRERNATWLLIMVAYMGLLFIDIALIAQVVECLCS